MAITATLLTNAGDGTDLSSYVTASISPPANSLILAAVSSEGSGAEEIPTLTGNGLTWVQVASMADAGPTNRITVFRAMGASPSAGAVTIDYAGATQARCGWSIAEFAAVDTSGTNGSGAVVQSKGATGTGTAGTADFDAAFGDATSHATYSALIHRNVNATAVEGSFAELSDELIDGAFGLQVMWLLGEDQTPAPTWVGSALFNQIVIEIKASGVDAVIAQAFAQLTQASASESTVAVVMG